MFYIYKTRHEVRQDIPEVMTGVSYSVRQVSESHGIKPEHVGDHHLF